MNHISKTIGYLFLTLLLLLPAAGCGAVDTNSVQSTKGEQTMALSGLKSNAKVLFLGDSITDGGRKYETNTDLANHAKLFGDYMKAHFPDEAITIFNTGIAGDTVLDLYYRLKEDCYDLNPDYIILEIGVNDAWNGYRGKETFEKQFRAVIKGIIDNTSAELILMTPYLLEATAEMQKNSVIPNINSYIPKVKEMYEVEGTVAKEFNIKSFAISEITDKAIKAGMTPASLSNDAIHPTSTLQYMMLDNIMLELGIKDYKPKYNQYVVVSPKS